MSKDSAEALLEQIGSRRGYVLEMHRILAEADPDFLRAYDAFLDQAYLRSGTLDRRTKELVYVAVLVALAAPREHVVAHMKAGLSAGVAPREMLEILEQILPPAGVPRFIEGIAAWRECCADGVPE